MDMGFAPTWLRQVIPLLHKTTLTTAYKSAFLMGKYRWVNLTYPAKKLKFHILLSHCAAIQLVGSLLLSAGSTCMFLIGVEYLLT